MTPDTQRLHAKPQTLDLLLALPAELRNEIYSYLLPNPLPEIILRARYARFQWIVISRRLFNDVAPILYSNSWLLTYLKLDPTIDGIGTVASNFKDHLRLTYGPDAPSWVIADACSIIRRLSVDVAAPKLRRSLQTFNSPVRGYENMASTFSKYFATASQTFSNLQSLRICFQHNLTHPEWCLDKSLRAALLEAADELRRTLPELCELEVLLRGTRNYNALSPLVMLSSMEYVTYN
jgi:hypothetical protein